MIRPGAKISEKDAVALVRRALGGEQVAKLAREYGISNARGRQYVVQAKAGRGWIARLLEKGLSK